MPSSLIFTGLVVLWLLILVPAVARHQQEVARVSGASLAGRVLTRPRRRGEGHPSEEGDSVDDEGAHRRDPIAGGVGAGRPAGRAGRGHRGRRTSAGARGRAGPTRTRRRPELETELDTDADDEDAADLAGDLHVDEPSDDADDRRWERPPPRFRPGRGGFDPDADAETARRRYAFRQRVVLALLIFALLTGVVAAAAVRMVWWAHGAIDLLLVGYLIYLRRQVREEAVIRERRAARMAGTRRTSAADDSDLDEWARRGREVTRRAPQPAERRRGRRVGPRARPPGSARRAGRRAARRRMDEDGDTTRVRGVGEPVGLLPARQAWPGRRRGGAGERPAPAPARPAAPAAAGDVAGRGGRRRARPARPRDPGPAAPPARCRGVSGW